MKTKKKFESVLHLACENGLASLVRLLLEKNADPNVKTSKLTCAHTPMHKAIINNHEEIVDIFIDFKSSNQKGHHVPDFNVKDANGQTVLSYCLWNGLLNLAKKLIG
jgi:ankyrin repeat protein